MYLIICLVFGPVWIKLDAKRILQAHNADASGRHNDVRNTRQYLLDHVENAIIVVEPDIVVGDGHLLEGDLLGVLEVRVWVPDFLEPVDRKKPVVAGLVLHFPVKP